MKYFEFYNKEVKHNLIKTLSLNNKMECPSILKVVINVGAGEAILSKGVLEKIQEQVALIAGQKPIITKARKSISAFKVRKGYPIGVKVTLRGIRMGHFLEKLITIVIPCMKDFKGVSEKSIDQAGNLNIGFPEQTIFHEIDFDKIDKIRGLEITIVSNAKNRERGKKLFELLGIPFKA